MNRREVLATAVAAALTPTGAIADGWPHPDVGRVADRDETGILHLGANMVIAGAFIAIDRIVDPGRVYTHEEWARVKDDVVPWLERRNAKLTA